MSSVATAGWSPLSGMQCLCRGLRPSLRVDGNMYWEEKLLTICAVQYELVVLHWVPLILDIDVWSHVYEATKTIVLFHHGRNLKVSSVESLKWYRSRSLLFGRIFSLRTAINSLDLELGLVSIILMI